MPRVPLTRYLIMFSWLAAQYALTALFAGTTTAWHNPTLHNLRTATSWRTLDAQNVTGTGTLLPVREAAVLAVRRKTTPAGAILLWETVTNSDLNYMIRYASVRAPFRRYRVHCPEISTIIWLARTPLHQRLWQCGTALQLPQALCFSIAVGNPNKINLLWLKLSTSYRCGYTFLQKGFTFGPAGTVVVHKLATDFTYEAQHTQAPVKLVEITSSAAALNSWERRDTYKILYTDPLSGLVFIIAYTHYTTWKHLISDFLYSNHVSNSHYDLKVSSGFGKYNMGMVWGEDQSYALITKIRPTYQDDYLCYSPLTFNFKIVINWLMWVWGSKEPFPYLVYKTGPRKPAVSGYGAHTWSPRSFIYVSSNYAMLYTVGLAYGVSELRPHSSFGNWLMFTNIYSNHLTARTVYTLLGDFIGISPSGCVVVSVVNAQQALPRALYLASSFIRDNSGSYERAFCTSRN